MPEVRKLSFCRSISTERRFGTSCKTGTGVTYKQLMPCSYNIDKTERVPSRKYIHALPYYVLSSCMLMTLMLSCIFNVYRFRTERRVVYIFAIDRHATMRGKKLPQKRCASSDIRYVRYRDTLCVTINCTTNYRGTEFIRLIFHAMCSFFHDYFFFFLSRLSYRNEE